MSKLQVKAVSFLLGLGYSPRHSGSISDDDKGLTGNLCREVLGECEAYLFQVREPSDGHVELTITMRRARWARGEPTDHTEIVCGKYGDKHRLQYGARVTISDRYRWIRLVLEILYMVY
jgi:hypothetical protein